MTPRVKGIGTINKNVHEKANSKLEYTLWKNVIKDCLLEATTEILEKQRGYDLPIELGKIIIFKLLLTNISIDCFLQQRMEENVVKFSTSTVLGMLEVLIGKINPSITCLECGNTNQIDKH
jgi:hypothetical protein